jgi:PTS system nitrogen regulatory IIA component
VAQALSVLCCEDTVDEATQWLCPQEIQLDLDVPDRREALQAVSTMVGRLRQVNAPPVFRALWRREQAGSTAVGNALAIPHARIAGITEPMFGLRSCSGSAQGADRSEPKA